MLLYRRRSVTAIPLRAENGHAFTFDAAHDQLLICFWFL